MLDLDNDSMAETEEIVTRVTADTFGRRKRGVALKIAYLDGGAQFYEDFKKAHAVADGDKESALINEHTDAIVRKLNGIERAIVIGNGPYEIFWNQEIQVFKHLAGLKDVVLIDMSQDYLDQGAKALDKLGKEMDKTFNVQAIRGDFKQVAGMVEPKPNTAVIATGGLFGNIENPGLDAFPIHEVQEQMRTFARLGGVGSKVWFSYFSKPDKDTAEGYYNTPELRRFFLNIPKIMADHCVGLKNFNSNPAGFQYVSSWNERADMCQHTLRILHSQRAYLASASGQQTVLDIRRNDEYILATSLRPTPTRMTEIPVENTGLSTLGYFSNGDLVEHLWEIKSVPAEVEEPYLNGSHNGNGVHAHNHGEGETVLSGKDAPFRKDGSRSRVRQFLVGNAPAPAPA